MKKVKSTILMLTMMVAALGFTSCGSSDDEDDVGNGGTSSSTSFSITIDGDKHEYDRDYLSLNNLMGTWESYSNTNYLKITIPPMANELHINFSYPTNAATFFTVGYSDFENDATRIALYGTPSKTCTYVSGSARVIKNDGKNLTIIFNNFSLTWNTSRTIAFDGTLNFVLDY